MLYIRTFYHIWKFRKMQNISLLFFLIYFILIDNNVSSFQASPKRKIYELNKTDKRNTHKYKDIISSKRNVKVLYFLKKKENNASYIKNNGVVTILRKNVFGKKNVHFLSLQNKINSVFYGESNLTIFEKLTAAVSYLLPFMDAVQAFIMPLLNILPVSYHKYLFQIESINQIYSSIPFLSFATFMGLYLLFVKENKLKFHYFIRYHHMQSLILSMFGYALTLFYFRVFPYSYNDTDIFNLAVLYSTMTVSFGSLIIPFCAALLGFYTTIPVISEAIKLHIGEKKIQRDDI